MNKFTSQSPRTPYSMDSNSNTSTQPHAVLICSPGIGHLIPFLELGKRLSSLHSFKSTVLFITTQPPKRSSLSPSLTSLGVDLLEIPAADISPFTDPQARLLTKIYSIMSHTGPTVRSALSDLTPKATLLIFDMFATGYVSMAVELGLPKLVYLPCSAWFVALTLHCPILHEEVKGEFVDQTEPLLIPGCKPVRPHDVVEPMLDRKDPQYKEYLRTGVEIPLFDGVLTNTWWDLEGSTLAALREMVQVPVYDIGPLTRTVDPFDEGNKSKEILEWLDRQPARSVLYVSFGSGGTLSTAQMSEVGWGLEMSQQRFVWVVRPPMEGEASASYFGMKGDVELGEYKYMPDGFVERTRGVGLLVPKWAPQAEILGHASVGGFLTHCGWNSTLEGVTNGVPMIAWPMFAEQRMNATMLVEELEVAVRPRESESVCMMSLLVGREEIEKMVRDLLEGEGGSGMRRRVEGLRRSAMEALSDEGSSFNCLSQLVQASSVHVDRG